MSYRNIAVVILGFMAVFANPSFANSNRIEQYFDGLRQLESDLAEKRFADLKIHLSEVRSTKAFEIPTYELLLFEAALLTSTSSA